MERTAGTMLVRGALVGRPGDPAGRNAPRPEGRAEVMRSADVDFFRRGERRPSCRKPTPAAGIAMCLSAAAVPPPLRRALAAAVAEGAPHLALTIVRLGGPAAVPIYRCCRRTLRPTAAA